MVLAGLEDGVVNHLKIVVPCREKQQRPQVIGCTLKD